MLYKTLLTRSLEPFRQRLLGFKEWRDRDYGPPSPAFVKERVLLRQGSPDAIWVESGTYLGQTTSFLAKHSNFVYSIEPEPKLFSLAKSRFAGNPRIEILNGSSEEILPGLLPGLAGNINFWLDGHFSAGITFKGLRDTPIVDELAAIRANLGRYQRVSILVDDVRCFVSQTEYPPLEYLVEWASDNAFRWIIEHDIFIMKNWTST